MKCKSSEQKNVNNVSTVVASFPSGLVDFRAKIVCEFNMAGSRCGDASYTNKAAFDAVTHPGDEWAWNCMYISVRYFCYKGKLSME